MTCSEYPRLCADAAKGVDPARFRSVPDALLGPFGKGVERRGAEAVL